METRCHTWQQQNALLHFIFKLGNAKLATTWSMVNQSTDDRLEIWRQGYLEVLCLHIFEMLPGEQNTSNWQWNRADGQRCAHSRSSQSSTSSWRSSRQLIQVHERDCPRNSDVWLTWRCSSSQQQGRLGIDALKLVHIQIQYTLIHVAELRFFDHGNHTMLDRISTWWVYRTWMGV